MLFVLASMFTVSSAWASVFGNLAGDLVKNSRVEFLKSSQIGWSWDLKADNDGAPIALLNIWSYRFIVLSSGWADPFNDEDQGFPSIMGGIHIDKLVRTIAPNWSDKVKSVVPSAIAPAWDALVLSYGPAYSTDRGEWSHIAAVNFMFGGE